MTFIVIVFALVAAVVMFTLALYLTKVTTDKKIYESTSPLDVPSDETNPEYKSLSSSGRDPFRVVALKRTLDEESHAYDYALGQCSTYYSQIKFLVKKRKFLTAIIFWLEAERFSKEAESLRPLKTVLKIPIDLEVIAGPGFMLAAKLPLIGRAWRKRTVQLLLAAAHEFGKIKAYQKVSNRERSVAVGLALVNAKLYCLTKGEKYLKQVIWAGLRRDDDPADLNRIARHLGMTLEELLEARNI